MIFDDNFLQSTANWSKSKANDSENGDETFEPLVDSPIAEIRPSEYGNPDGDYVIESDLVTPKVPVIEQNEDRPLIVVVDDDFETLDLLEIYLTRNYEYVSFSGPREAIFYLNQRVPALILIDCKIHTMKATTFAEIVRAGAGKKDVPFIYLGTDDELRSIDTDNLPEYIKGCLKRPVARGDLQGIIDRTIKKNNNAK